MTSQDIRTSFLEYFEDRAHRVVPSSPLVLPNDPTLLFANAGMNQFKDVFTGRERRDYRRAASSQKCLRVSGKHNDLETVGRTARHHTFFEMLGNFSFGDYFKREAIEFAWDLVHRHWGVPAERLWVSVFGGSDAAVADEEAFALWRDVAGVPAERILRLGEKDNFWRMGDLGPCGPCTEIYFDLGDDLTSTSGPSTPQTDERRYVEIWNLVFMQFEQRPDGMVALPAPSVDTGMGLERVASVLQDRRSNYDTDLFRPLIAAAADRAGVTYGRDPERDISLRVIADHARALCFLVADGIVPSNDNRGYVLRRIVRRAIRHGRKLGIDEPFLGHMVPAVLDTLGGPYPELVASRDVVLEIAAREERQFAETLTTGLRLFDEAVDAERGRGARVVLPGAELFRLYDTFGLPLDVARDIAEEQGVELDEDGFEREMSRQRATARASWKGGRKDEASSAYRELAAAGVRSKFEGYGRTALEGARLLAILKDGQRVDRLAEGDDGEVVLDATPFYAEAGGQVGDTGAVVGQTGRASVTDTQRPAEGLIVSRVRMDRGELAVGQTVAAEVDARRRDHVRRNHTATHLVHAALREVVGSHVKQSGSLVAADRLRFDFSHFAGLSDRALADVEDLVNERALEDTAVETEVMDLDDALRAGAMALFGERYGDRVRVVRIGGFSLELCGGVHVDRSAEVGLFRLVSERGVAAGVRRVEAITGTGSVERFRGDEEILVSLEQLLAVSRTELLAEFGRRLERTRALEKELERVRLGGARAALLEAAESAQVVAGVKVMTGRADALKPSEAREVADNVRRKLGSGVVVLGRAQDDKASILVAVTEDLTDRLAAGDLVRELAAMIGGGGGGRKDMAEAGGKDAARLDDALRAAPEVVRKRLE